MDDKLKDALAAKDYYSAHQIYLAIAQRHSRSKRFEETKQVLREGSLTLSEVGEHRSAVDLAKRYLDGLSFGRLPLIDTDAVSVHSVFVAIGRGSGSDQTGEALRTLSELALKEHPSLLLVIFQALLQLGAHREAGSVLLRGEDVDEEWRLLGAAVGDPLVVLALTLSALKARNFGALSHFLSAVLDSRFSEVATLPEIPALEDLPDFVRVVAAGELSGDAEILARTLNLCQLLFVIFQHRLTPSPSALTKVLQHYAGLLAKLRVKEDELKALEHSFLIQQHAESGAAGMGGAARPDMLANLFQTMMAQGMGPSGPIRKK